MAFKLKRPNIQLKKPNLNLNKIQLPKTTAPSWNDVLSDLDIPEALIQRIVNSVLEFKDAYVRVPEKLNKFAGDTIEVIKGKVILSNWMDVLRSFDGGDCVDIVQMLVKEWKASGILDELEAADVLVEYIEGTEPEFFNSEEDNHAFLELSTTVKRVVVDPTLQVISSKASSGYETRTKKSSEYILNLERSPERELELGSVSDTYASETAVVGLTDFGDCVVSIGFVDGRLTVTPLLKLSVGTNRYYISFENERETGTEDVKFNGISDESMSEISRIIRIVKEYMFKTTVVLEDTELKKNIVRPRVVEIDADDVYDESIYKE
jgi:hypothetical protein